MNKKISLLLFSLAMFMVVPFTALGIGFPHDNTQAVGCTHCHNATASLSTNLFNNMCTSCHKPGSANVNIRSPFYQTDAANIYNRFNGYSAGVIPVDKLKYTSHNWAGPMEAPEAGASKPVDPKMNIKTLGTTLSCARCHNVHGYESSTVNSSPFLRTLNSNDEMCRDCHRKRDTSSHLLGSHPVNFRYTSATSKVVTESADYFNPPRNANPANPTSAMKLVNGKIQCTSCHAAHYSDSNSGTEDNKEYWANLSSSRGMLLRSDTFGKTDAITSVNICTNCHNKPNHQVYPGSKTNAMPIQCVDCHSGHVEYLKPADVVLGGDNATPNVYLLRRYVNYSAGVKLDSYRRKAFLTSTSSTSILRNDNGTAVCQACHNLPSNIPDHLTASTKDKCIICHVGSLHTTVKPINCIDCHGFPPQHNVAGTVKYGMTPSYGYAVYSGSRSYLTFASGTIFKNESTAGHPTHAAGKPYSYSCNECHKGNAHLNEVSRAYQDVYADKSGIIAGATATFTAGGASSTCSNLFCHSYGTAVLKGAKTVGWASGVRGSIVGTTGECIACHNGVGATFNNLSTGSHFRHVSKDPASGKIITCNVCHSATVSSNTVISNYANHVNGTRNLSFSGTAAGTTSNGTTCSTYCHTNGKGAAPLVTPNWTDRNSGKCGTCHLTAVSTGSGIIFSNAHFTHISSSYGPKRNTNNLCGACHIFTGELSGSHVDGSISKNSGATYCQNCHAQSVPVWTNSTRLSCQSCHSGMGNGDTESVVNRSWSNYDATGVQAPYKSYSTFTNRGHGNFANSNSCSKCHNSTATHFDGALGSADKRLFTANDNTQCSSCHADPAIVLTGSKQVTSTHATARGVYAMDCKVCHEVHGNGNIKMVKTTFVFGALTSTITYGSSSDLVSLTPPYRGVCQTCHTNTTHYRRNVNEGSNHPTTGCLNCHSHIDTFAFKPKACDECHGYPPAPKGFVPTQSNFSTAKLENYSGGGGAHVKAGHVLANVRPNQGFAPCVVCHNDGAGVHVGRMAIFDPMTSPATSQKMANTSVRVDAGYKFNATQSLGADQYRKATPGNTGSCWNVSCHFQASPRWSNDK